MATLLLVFTVLSALTPWLTRLLGTRVFYVIALLPAGAFAYTLTQTAVVTVGGSVTQSIPWIPALGISLSFRVDTLAWLLALVVTGIGALVLVYCASYFSPDEPGLGRFAALLLAFAGTMYGLVTADDLLVMFMFWEITSVLSYLLIGHYTSKRESRGAALQALLVTTFGGLIMLVGVIMISVGAGTTSLAVIVAQPVTGPLGTWGILLILVGALSKSALVPFHFWLPAAMAAPTPVSAYLHAAAMVKAGIYIVARLAPGYADSDGWLPVLVTLGVWTMLVGAWRSLRQYDLKLLLAYGTVSQLGFLMIVVGFGTRNTALAGAALLLAHALYKATLFLVVGVIDHRAGTRDWRALSGVGRSSPALAVIALIAVASMAGIPPLFGYVAKEAVFTSLLDAGVGGSAWGWIALVGTAVGSVLTVAYSIRFFWGAFGTRPTVATTVLHPSPRDTLLAPAVLTVATVALGVFASALDPLLAPYANTVPGDGSASEAYYLALWHGLEPALLLSAVVIGLGVLLFRWRRRVARLQATVPAWIDAGHGYGMTVRAVDRTAARLTYLGQRGGLPQYLGTILVVFVLALGFAAAVNRSWPERIVLWDYPGQVLIALIMGIAAVMAARVGQRMTAVLLAGVTGFGLVVLFAFHGAPDLALTQALVETITLVIFVLVLRRLPTQIAQHNRPRHRKRRALIGALVGIVMGTIGVVALGARQDPSIASELPRLAVEEGHGNNIVNVMLVDIRAWDTLGEIAVLIVVATGVASLLFVSGRNAEVPRLRDSRRLRLGRNRRRVIADPEVSGEGHAVTRQAFLVAGRKIPAQHRSILIEVLVRMLFHPAIIVSLYLLFAGHNEPGGGFAGGLIAGLALVLRYIAGGRYELGEAAPIDPGKILGLGIILAGGLSVVSLVFGGVPLESAYVTTEVPVLGSLSFGTSTIFDIGVYLVVIGLVYDILRSLGSEIDRQSEVDELGPELQTSVPGSGLVASETTTDTAPVTTWEGRA
ncbi:Na+/H+ antiporter subunit A [Cryobacterium psychrophilum]|uniref:Na+/H+ antiporter subunit A n=1 Tax=Cryobacterium psychrophilum TaxID=41988 RepID=A0A4Y8KTA5_9MICO|nr:Na+/H+ antiporter subunit A [Cryobacterium psychrophilum]TDW29576.1 multisubunit sodium/proton antiporter MrpA subunit /multisubunit sodium/proton antiporter MrpB subunit [Cryobacterium psychrophilum]TFD81708.1 Na+/H+ antiporter subunit A [Cryobacterium psychrophilum]